MATPTPTSYAVAHGATARCGRVAPGPAWAAGLVNDSFVTLAAPLTLKAFLQANLPAGAYQGSNPYDGVLNAFCDPANGAGKQYIYGGGHSDSTVNSVVEHDLTTLAFSIKALPTPPAKYPPSYLGTSVVDIVYPSGAAGDGFFRDNLTDPADTAYNTTRARGSSHMYAAAALRPSTGVVHYFYQHYAEFNTTTGAWANTSVDIGAQIFALNSNFGNFPLQQGTVAIYDDVLDKFLVTLVPGDQGLSWRSSIMVFNPATRLVEGWYDFVSGTHGNIRESMNFCKIGRKLYGFTKIGSGAETMNQGFIFDMDTHAFQYFTLVGDTSGSVYDSASGADQETIPSWYDGRFIRRWNYRASQRGNVYSVNLTPESGTGTSGDPFLLRQTVRALGGAIPTNTTYAYTRMVYVPEADCALLIPRADTLPVAIKLS